MAVIQKDIVVPDYLLPKIMNGSVEITGLAKNVNNKQVVKHLATLDPDNKDSSAELVAMLVSLGIVAVAGIGAGIYGLISKAKVSRFKEALNEYIDAVNNKVLTIEIINNLVDALDKLKGKTRKTVQIQFSSDELTALIECLCNHTQTLANANNIKLTFETTESEKSDILLRLRNNLVKQRDIFELAA